MEKQDLKHWEFQRELIAMAASCVGLKPNTAKRKAAAVFDKYRIIISSSESMEDYYRNRGTEFERKFYALKKGSVEYIKGKVQGKLLIKDIEQIEVKETDILIITKTGRQITLGSDFKYLIDLL